MDAYTRGLTYLESVRGLALSPDLIYEPDGLAERMQIGTWIGQSIDPINTQLRHYLEQCHQCFHAAERRSIEIFAAPIREGFQIDGCCNLARSPITIVLDVGRSYPHDWLSLVVHEYAHAHTGHPGHTSGFAKTLRHLCLGLGLPLPPSDATETYLRHWPHCPPVPSSLAFWLGQCDAL